MAPRLPFVCLLALVAALSGCVADEQVRAVQKSMEPAIRSGEVVRVDADAYDTVGPSVGDIVALLSPSDAGLAVCGVRRRPAQPCQRTVGEPSDGPGLVKRIVAGPGQRVAIAEDGGVIVDGEPQDEPYVQLRCAPVDGCALPRAVRVPPDSYFVLGDNRPYSSDSRDWGAVPRRWIEGRVQPARPRP